MQSEVVRIESLKELELPNGAVVICDRIVEPLLGSESGWTALFVDGGEELKSLASIEELAGRVLEKRSTRPMTIVAVGGGSVGDAVGFLASVLWRGVDLWHVPTTLLAAVDSAHGGKTAVNLENHKNQLGTFWPAQRVVLVDELLRELPLGLRTEGMTELIKGLWLGDAEALDLLDEVGVDAICRGPWENIGDPLMDLLDRAIAVKQSIVEQDPRELDGIRTFLNFGHTAAHAIELIEGLSHGEAVAWGMAAASYLSVSRGGLSPDDATRLRRHVFGLLGESAPRPDREAFVRAVAGDKKRVAGKLRSVLLTDAADPIVVDDLDAGDWFEALSTARVALGNAQVRIYRPHDFSPRIELSASKSELNRMLAIAALRHGPTTVVGASNADDVRHMRAGVEAMSRGEEAYAGSGGTTFRFLVAVAAAKGTSEKRIRISKQLASRPHEPLFEAIRQAGGLADWVEPQVLAVRPCPSGSLDFVINSDQSSQYASALALMAAAGRRVNLRVSKNLPSRGYFEMTLELLERAGVSVTRDGRDHRLIPTDRLSTAVTLHAAADASSAALWRVLQWLGVDAEFSEANTSSLQPDADIGRYHWAPNPSDPLEFDVGDAPDLVPVLAAYACITEPQVRLVGASHLRVKESNRIDDLAAAFGDVGLSVVPLEDGLEIPAGRQLPSTGRPFRTFGDHRLAMAAVVLSFAAGLEIDAPRVVSKSYPTLWNDLRSAGWVIRPVASNS